MDSDSDNSDSPSPPDNKYNATSDEDPDSDNSMWNKILRSSYDDNKEFWFRLLSKDKTQFRLKFKEAFLEQCKTSLDLIDDFVENDETWASILETKSKLYDMVEENDDEALLSAIDARKYKIYKLIDWQKVEDDIQYDSEQEEEKEEVATDNDDGDINNQ